MHTTSTPTTPTLARRVDHRRRLALLVAPALALVIAVGCGSDEPAGETAVMGASLDRPSQGTQPAEGPIDAGSRPRRIVAESTDRAAPLAPSEALRIGGVRVVAESTDRVRPADANQVAGSRYAAQAEAAHEAAEAESADDGTDWPTRVNGGRTEE